jgi:hypothetical protein
MIQQVPENSDYELIGGSYNLRPDQINLLFNRYMVFFEPNSTDILAFDFSTSSWRNCANTAFFKHFSDFNVVQLPDFSFFLTGGQLQGFPQPGAFQYSDGNLLTRTPMRIPRR